MIDVGAHRTAARPRRARAGKRSGRSSCRSVPYWYDAANRMTNVVSPDGKATYYAYDASGLQTRRLLGNMSAVYFAYDTAGRMTELKNVASDGSPLSQFTYGRLAGGNISRILRENDNAVYYEYDLADKLVSETWRDSGHTQIYAFLYDYDAAGNRVAEDKDGVPTYYYYDVANELTNRWIGGGESTYYAYDENGSLVTEYAQSADEATYYEYNDNGLTSKIIPSTGNPTEFFYDGRMQRFAIDFGGNLSYFAWDGMNQILEKDSSLSTVAQHTHGATPVAGIGTIITTKRSSDFQYPHYDHRGSLFNLEDTGVADLEAEYNGFGEELQRSGAAVTRFGYQGTAWMRLDSGLLVSPTRLYVSGVGRFQGKNQWAQVGAVSSGARTNRFGKWRNWTLAPRLWLMIVRGRDRMRTNLYDYADMRPVQLVEPMSTPRGEARGDWDTPSDQLRREHDESMRRRDMEQLAYADEDATPSERKRMRENARKEMSPEEYEDFERDLREAERRIHEREGGYSWIQGPPPEPAEKEEKEWDPLEFALCMLKCLLPISDPKNTITRVNSATYWSGIGIDAVRHAVTEGSASKWVRFLSWSKRSAISVVKKGNIYIQAIEIGCCTLYCATGKGALERIWDWIKPTPEDTKKHLQSMKKVRDAIYGDPSREGRNAVTAERNRQEEEAAKSKATAAARKAAEKPSKGIIEEATTIDGRTIDEIRRTGGAWMYR